MYCQNCGKEIKDGNFCTGCGAKIDRSDPIVPSDTEKNAQNKVNHSEVGNSSQNALVVKVKKAVDNLLIEQKRRLNLSAGTIFDLKAKIVAVLGMIMSFLFNHSAPLVDIDSDDNFLSAFTYFVGGGFGILFALFYILMTILALGTFFVALYYFTDYGKGVHKFWTAAFSSCLCRFIVGCIFYFTTAFPAMIDIREMEGCRLGYICTLSFICTIVFLVYAAIKRKSYDPLEQVAASQKITIKIDDENVELTTYLYDTNMYISSTGELFVRKNKNIVVGFRDKKYYNIKK